MYEYLPLLIIGGIIGIFTLIFVIAYFVMQQKKSLLVYDRHMADSVIIRRLFAYAKPYWGRFVLAILFMIVSIAYDLISPLIVGYIEKLVAEDFSLTPLFTAVGIYASILVVSMICTYFQAVLMQKTGQKIVSSLRMDVFTHIESLSHDQLNHIPVGKLVTRVSNDTAAISYLFTNVLVTLAKNIFVIIGVTGAMLLLNYALTLMVLCFVPFVVLFTVIFRRFSRKAHRNVSDATTDINTYLSENLSGMKITQIFNREEKKMDDFLLRSKKLQKAKFGRMFVFGIFRPMVYLLNISSVLFLFYIGSRGYIQNTTFLGQAITANILVSF